MTASGGWRHTSARRGLFGCVTLDTCDVLLGICIFALDDRLLSFTLDPGRANWRDGKVDVRSVFRNDLELLQGI